MLYEKRRGRVSCKLNRPDGVGLLRIHHLIKTKRKSQDQEGLTLRPSGTSFPGRGNSQRKVPNLEHLAYSDHRLEVRAMEQTPKVLFLAKYVQYI